MYPSPGDTITCDLLTGAGATGLQGIAGEVAHVELDDRGRLAWLVVHPPDLEHPLHIRGDLVAIWRRGGPVRQQLPQGIAIPTGLPPGLLGPNGGR